MPRLATNLCRVARLVSSTLLLCLLPPAGRAEDRTLPDHPRYAIEHFGDRYGIGAITVTALAQDATGFLWIGAQSGLYRYDGASLKRFGVADGLPSLQVFQLLVAPDGALWVRTRKGIARLQNGKFVELPPPPESLGWAIVNQSLALDGEGTLFASTVRGLLRLDLRTHEQRILGKAAGLPADQIEALTRAPDDAIWFAAGRKLGRFRPGTVRPEILSAPELPPDTVQALVADGSGRLWVRTNNHLAVLNTRSGAPKQLVFHDQGLPGANMYGGPTLDQQGNLMLPTSSGLYRWTGEGWEVIGQSNGLTSSAIFAALQDREGAIWIGLAGAGLDRWPGSSHWSGWTDAEGLPDSLVLSVARDVHSRIWVGTNTGLGEWDPSQQQWKKWKGLGIAPISGVRQLVVTRDGALWALFSPGVITRFDAAAPRPIPMRPSLPRMDGQVSAIAAALDGSVWASGEDGFLVIRRDGGRFAFEWIALPPENAGTSRSLSFSPDGILWTGGPRGVSRFVGGRWRHYDQSDGLLDNSVRSVRAVRDNEVWIGYTDVGSITRAQLLPDGHLHLDHFRGGVCAMGMDRGGSVWLEMEQSAAALAPDGRLHNFSQSDGLLWNDLNCDAFWQDSDGAILLGTSRGLARYEPDSQSKPQSPPPVVLLSVQLGAREQSLAAHPSVPYRDRTFIARFAAVTFRDPDRISCRYRLSGLENEFIETSQREARYSSLPPGDYTFEVSCGSVERGWSIRPAAYSFTVEPAWWGRWWARLAGLVVLALLGWAVYHYRAARHALERARLKAAIDAGNAELARANEELKQASLTDPMTGLRNRRFFCTTVAADASQALRAYRLASPNYSTDHRDLTLFLIDVDRFKEINDIYGHDAGDRMLVEIGCRLNRIVRLSDFLIRWGGEEFLVVCRAAQRADARVMAERILATVAHSPYDLGRGRLAHRTCSIGWASFPWLTTSPDALPIEEVLKLADRGLYLAKQRGRNQAVGILPDEQSKGPAEAAPGRGQSQIDPGPILEMTVPGPIAPQVTECEAMLP